MDFFAPPFYGHCTNAKLWFLKCIAKEADMICELLRRDAHPVDDYLINQGTAMRMCALSLMNCTSDNSVSASAVMLVRAFLQNPPNIISSINS